MKNEEVKPIAQTKRNNTKIVLLIVLMLGGLFIWWAASLGSSKGTELESSITSYRAVNPGELTVEYEVKNTSDKTGISSCSITMHDESYEYRGNDSGYESAKEIVPNETYSGVASLKISNDGAEYITKGAISCTIE
jgi:hypothetical protein